jgi:hypothetical protein
VDRDGLANPIEFNALRVTAKALREEWQLSRVRFIGAEVHSMTPYLA